ncbi:GNAT family N-acetyltransferase [Gorillibacterium massiliense]|uniref:GNAT family N-acetyltransferase n=1 Tax=Gorillibacterium massiliense TaxID=1280390 RepID=UPI0004BAF2C7|nr:GNAT family protein [Gorillibacterium massiliense]
MLAHCGTKRIETERLLLRPFEPHDAEDMLMYWISDPLVQSMYFEPVYSSIPEVQEMLGKIISSYNKDDYYRWAIIEKETQICIGQIAFFLVDSGNHFGELEYCIGQLFQRKGYATEATKAVVDYGFRKVHFHKIQICHADSNSASKGVISKCGFTYEGTLRDYFFIEGRYASRLYYSMLRDEWEAPVV